MRGMPVPPLIRGSFIGNRASDIMRGSGGNARETVMPCRAACMAEPGSGDGQDVRQARMCDSDMWCASGDEFWIMNSTAPRNADKRDNDKREDESPTTGVVVKTRPATKKPAMYKVLMLNDDYTPMEFVVHVLERFFQKTRDEATRIMLHVHRRGVGVCGVYTYEVAETKVTQVMDLARQNQHPLQCTIEKD